MRAIVKLDPSLAIVEGCAIAWPCPLIIVIAFAARAESDIVLPSRTALAPLNFTVPNWSSEMTPRPTLGASWTHSADEFALDTYPCQHGNGCNYSWITNLAAAADRLGLKYVGVAQAFGGDGHYDLPTAAQLHQIIHTWQATKELGYVVYAFSAVGMPSSTWLQNEPGLLSVIAAH